MSRVSIRLGDFFRRNVTEDAGNGQDTDNEATPPAGDDSGDGSDADDDGQEGDDQGDGQEGESTGGANDTADDDAGGVKVVEMTTAAYEKQVADAGAYQKIKGEYDTLKAWKASLDGMGKGKGKAGDQNTAGMKADGVMTQPWNKAAQDAAAKA